MQKMRRGRSFLLPAAVIVSFSIFTWRDSNGPFKQAGKICSVLNSHKTGYLTDLGARRYEALGAIDAGSNQIIMYGLPDILLELTVRIIIIDVKLL